MVFGLIRDLWSYLLGRNYPSPKLLEELRETKPKPSTALVKFRRAGGFATWVSTGEALEPLRRHNIQLLRQPVLRSIEDDEKEAWLVTHPSQSVCVRRLQIHEEF